MTLQAVRSDHEFREEVDTPAIAIVLLVEAACFNHRDCRVLFFCQARSNGQAARATANDDVIV